MKILDRKQFLAIPGEVLHSKYAPSYFEDFSIKCGTLATNDFIYQSITDAIKHTGSESFGRILDVAHATGSSVEMDFDCCGRDGCFDDDQLFAVWEKQDVEALIKRLQDMLAD